MDNSQIALLLKQCEISSKQQSLANKTKDLFYADSKINGISSYEKIKRYGDCKEITRNTENGTSNSLYQYNDNGYLSRALLIRKENNETTFQNETKYYFDDNDNVIFSASRRDIDGDNKIDAITYSYFNDNQISMEEHDYNLDGEIDCKEYFIWENDDISKILVDNKNDEKIDYIKHYMEKDGQTGIKIEYANLCNGKIDETFSQGRIGDCWLLASIEGIRNSELREELEKNIIKNNDGSWTIKFAGANLNYNISEEEVQEAKRKGYYSNGEDDVLLLELAFEKHRKEYGKLSQELFDEFKNTTQDNVLNGGDFFEFSLLMFGSDDYKTGYEFKNFNKVFELKEKNPDKYCVYMSFGNTDKSELVLKDVEGNDITLASESHAWSIESVDNNTVTIINPHDTSKKYTFNRNKLSKVTNETFYLTKYSPIEKYLNKIRRFLTN